MPQHDQIVRECNSDVVHYVFRSHNSGLWSSLRRMSIFYLLAAQSTVLLPTTSRLTVILTLLVPRLVRQVLADFWLTNPKTFAFAFAALLLFLYRSYPVLSQEESILAMRSLGIQTTSRGTSRFIPTENVRLAICVDLNQVTDGCRSRTL